MSVPRPSTATISVFLDLSKRVTNLCTKLHMTALQSGMNLSINIPDILTVGSLSNSKHVIIKYM